MHPGHFQYYYRYRHRPSRLIWFVIGGVSAALFIKHREIHSDAHHVGWCRRRVPIQAPPNIQRGYDNTTGTGTGMNPPSNSSQWRNPPPWESMEQQSLQKWEQEKAQLLALGHQATDTVRIFIHWSEAAWN
jgi:hypothetical protein